VIKSLSYGEIIHGILELDKCITSATIVRLASGKILATNYKERAELPSLTIQESELFIMQSVIRMSTQTTLEYKLGKVLYSITLYENMTTASMYLFSERYGAEVYENNNNDDEDTILILSFDKNANHELIIKSKVMPFLKQKIAEVIQLPKIKDKNQSP